MKVLVVGQGGREHALAWKLAGSPSVTRLWITPGNAGTGSVGTNLLIPETDHRGIVSFATKEKLDLVVIGPEGPLCEGLADKLRDAGIAVFGPSQKAAELEGSKVFCKTLLRKAGVPSADFKVFDEFPEVEHYLGHHLNLERGFVVKTDGLAAGKGAIVCDNDTEAYRAAKRMLLDREFGRAGERILIEERLDGPEVSLFCITDGKTLLTLPLCQDHKRALDGDLGPNTGGMGAYSPADLLTERDLMKVEDDILIPTLHQLRLEKRPFRGVLFAGLMVTKSGPKILEYNVRFGDPECQTLMVRLKSDLATLLHAVAVGKLDNHTLEWDPRPAVCVVMASGGYPGAYPQGKSILGLDDVKGDPDVVVFHAGTKKAGDRIVTAGGRVLSVVALGDTIADARAKAYAAVAKIRFDGAQFRKDIALKAEGAPAVS